MATANWNGLIKLWNVEEGKLLRSFSCTNIIALAFSPDGGSLACCTIHGEVELWDLGKDQPSIFPTSAGRSFDLAFSPDGQILAIANQSHDISLWDVTRQQLVQTLAGHAKEVTAVAFSPDGKSLASGSQDDAVMLWNPSGRAERASITNVAIPDYEKVGVPVFSRDGRHLAAGTLDDGMIVLETESGEVNLRGAIHGLPVAFSDDDKSLLTHEDGSSAYVDWDLATGSILASNQLANRMTHILDSTFSPDGKTIAFSRGGGQIVMMNAVTGGFLFALSVPSDARCLAFSPDGQMLGTGSFDGIARLWDLRQRRVVWTVAGFRDTVAAVVFCTNGVFAAGSWDGSIKICDPVAQKELATLIGHKAGIKKLAFASDGRTLASGADDCTVKLWNLAIGREVLSFKTEVPQYFVTFSPDDKFLVTGGRDGVVHFWRAPSFSAIAAAENSGKP
jgi:WD40 repeat protein